MSEDKKTEEQKKQELADYPGAYGGGVDRAGETAEQGFGERGWGDAPRVGVDANKGAEEGGSDLPKQIQPVPDGDEWQERFLQQNAGKFGDGGHEPIAQRGSSGSMGGYDDREQSLGSTKGVTPKGGYGAKDTPTTKEKE